MGSSSMSREIGKNPAVRESCSNLQAAYCVLEYRPEPWTKPAESVAPVFLIVVDGRDGLHFFLNPAWREFVLETDVEYIELIIRDFHDRALQSPRQLFDQLSSLSLGPLVTAATGTDLSGNASLQKLSSEFDLL
jgi:hypothetical protein